MGNTIKPSFSTFLVCNRSAFVACVLDAVVYQPTGRPAWRLRCITNQRRRVAGIADICRTAYPDFPEPTAESDTGAYMQSAAIQQLVFLQLRIGLNKMGCVCVYQSHPRLGTRICLP